MSILRLEKIGFKYAEDWILKDISFEVLKGEFMGVLGPNGSGKTTLLKLIDGILGAREGGLWIDGLAVAEMKRETLARLVAVVPQDSQMVFPFTVQEIVLMGRMPHLGQWRFEGERDFEIAREAMEMTDTWSLAARKMNTLSGGERQRVLIARALAQQPRLLLLDEPTAFLDIRHQIDFFDLIRRLNREQTLTVIAVTHDINLASLYCDRIILLNEGSVHCMGEPAKVITVSHIQDVYKTPVSVDRNPVTGLPMVTPLSSTAMNL
jgi:iron complex transport system ATP-binding protein